MTAKLRASKEKEEEAAPEKAELIIKRNKLINELRAKLLTKRDLWKGGSVVRSKHTHEASTYQAIINEINEIGIQVDEAPIQLGHIRREG